MARRKTPGLAVDDSTESFDVDGIITIASLIYNIRETIMSKAIQKSDIKKRIPKSTVLSVIKSLGLDKYLEKE